MGKGFDNMKRRLVNFKMHTFCRLFPLGVGLLLTGYLNASLALISLVAAADEAFTPILMQIQDVLLGDNAKKPVPVIAYAIELSFSVLLLCAVYRKDRELLRVYMKYCFAALIASVLVYSTIVAAVSVLLVIVLVASIVFQVYVVFIVRSYIVELKLEERKHHSPTMVMSTINETKISTELEEVKIEAKESEVDEHTPEDSDKKDKLETLEEHSKGESSSEEDEEEKEEQKK